MKRLTLIRHAKSSWKDSTLPDFERPLNARGQRDAPRMAERAARRGCRPDRLVASPARRARDTMECFAVALARSVEEISFGAELYGATPGELLAVVQALDDPLEHVALCGHNPGVSELARLLTRQRLPDLPTCAVITIELPVLRWRETAPGVGRVLHLDTPKRSGAAPH